MLRLDTNRPVSFCDGLTRRDFLHAGALPLLGLTLPGLMAQKAAGNVPDRDVNCIMLFLVGGPSPGYLGKQHDPFVLNADPSDPKFKVPDLLPPEYISAVRAERRQKMRDAVDGALAAFEKNAQARQLDDNFNLAYRLMSSPQAREAFALEKEPAAVRDRYGRTRFGQCCLMARRLIEAGVRFVTVNMFETVFDEVTWDIHGSKPFTDIAEMSKQVAPNFDQAYSTLLEELQERGLLSSTMVVALGEFGRTPKVNPAGGRDHHPGAWTIVIGG